MRKTAKILLSLCLVVFFLAGCEEKMVFDNPETMSKLTDKTVQLTEKAIVDKDIKLARDLWGQISEYGITAKEMGNNDLAVSLDKLACTYPYLVDYLMTGEQQKLDHFNTTFRKAIEELKTVSFC